MRPDFRFTVACMICLAANTAFAELKLVSTEFFPASFTAGTRVRVFVRLDPGSGSLPEGTVKPAPEPSHGFAPSIHGIELKKDGKLYIYTVTFTSWEPGPGTLPSLAAGTEILPAIPIMTESALAQDASLPLPRGQKEPDGVRVRVYLFVGLLLFLLSGAVFSGFAFPKILASLLVRRGILRARKSFFQVLSELEKGGDSGPESWKRLCIALRTYLGFRLAEKAVPAADKGPLTAPLPASLPALTAREFSQLPSDSLPGGCHDAVAEIFLRADMVRWAGTTDGRLVEALRVVREAVGKLESALSGKPAEFGGRPGGEETS